MNHSSAQFIIRCACVAMLVACSIAAPSHAAETTTEKKRGLAIYWVDVEGGAATLIVTPAGETVLIDTGNPGDRDPGRIHKALTELAKAKQVDHLVTTHYHRDHYGGAAALAKKIPIVNLYDNANYDERAREAGEQFADYRAMKVAKRIHLKPGMALPVKQQGDQKLSITCLGARQQFIKPGPQHKKNPFSGERPQRRIDRSDNANSIVLLINYGDFEFFDGGDLTWNVEEKLVYPINLVGKVDVAQVNHHGLDSSSNPLLYRSIEPHVVVFNNGDKKGCQPLAFQAVRGTPSIKAIFQMHKNLRKDKQHNADDSHIANLKQSRECEGHHLELHVSADSKKYTVVVGSRGTVKTFETK